MRTEVTRRVCPPIELLAEVEPVPPLVAVPLVPLALPVVLVPVDDPLALPVVPVTSTLWPTCFFSSVSWPSSV